MSAEDPKDLEKSPKNVGVIGERIAAFLKQAYPRHHAKRLAQDFGCSPGTAERWLSGTAPKVDWIEKMYARWGEQFARALFPEAFAQNDQRLKLLSNNLRLAMLSGAVGGVAAVGAVLSGQVTPAVGMARLWQFTTNVLDGGARPSSDAAILERQHLLKELLDTIVPEPSEEGAKA